MASLGERAKVWFAEQRTARPWLDHVVRTQQHYTAVKGNTQAGAVTFFGFLSFFPLLALAFFAVGWVSRVYPAAEDGLVQAITDVFPGMIGSDEGQIAISDFEQAAAAAGVIGLLGVLYSGLGWLSGLRESLLVVFDEPAKEQPSFVVGKLRDLVALASIGVILLTSVAVSSVLSNFATEILDLVGLGEELSWLLRILTVVVGILVSSVLFTAMFRLLAKPDIPRADLWRAALVGAVGFEVLKQVAGLLLGSTRGQPAFQAFGIALILVVWINYFSRVVMYAASWAQTSTSARLRREAAAAAEEARLAALRVDLDKEDEDGITVNQAAARSFALGAGTVAGLYALLRRPRAGARTDID
ncbi:YihY/virulence factor BrkB family protein [Nocardioides zeae]|uniref:YihY/virulence factor BrkB family protein n=1 Tax=Nocardioides imazamoxiresistens TaxID=3231893 RepID=A0ABU3PU57_9ACTN|nr:YihY/virulence factor BrkB family protein [Nocardioides zeae]MDT9592764.1 YihY/virulence factor BrkB family protein [Nocardioides zeae]